MASGSSSARMYAISRDLHPPTGVEHCLECHFFDLKKTSLLVASTSLLRVYEVSGVSVGLAPFRFILSTFMKLYTRKNVRLKD